MKSDSRGIHALTQPDVAPADDGVRDFRKS